MHAFCKIRFIIKLVQHTLYRRQSGSSCNHHHMLTFKLVNRPAFAISPAEEQDIPCLFLKNLICHLAHGADGEIHVPIPE